MRVIPKKNTSIPIFKIFKFKDMILENSLASDLLLVRTEFSLLSKLFQISIMYRYRHMASKSCNISGPKMVAKIGNFWQFSPITEYRGNFGKFHNILVYINCVCLFKI